MATKYCFAAFSDIKDAEREADELSACGWILHDLKVVHELSDNATHGSVTIFVLIMTKQEGD